MSSLLSAIRHELIADEALRLKPYTDSRGLLTIGIGRCLETKGLTEAEALYLCDQDIYECLRDLQTAFPWFAQLTGERTQAVINLRFNLGPTGFRTFKKFLAAMAAGNYETAADELIDSAWYTQVGRSRRERIVRQIRDGA